MDLFHLGTWLVSSGEWETFCKVVMGLYQCLFQSIAFYTIDLYYHPLTLIGSGTYKSGTGRPIPSYLGKYLQKQTRIIRPPKTVIQNCSILHFVFFGDPAKSTLDLENWYLLPLPKTCLRKSLSCSLLKYSLLGLFGFISGLWSGVILLRHASQLCEFLPNRHPAI